MRSEFNVSCGRGQGVLVASPLQEVRIKIWAGLNGFDSRNELVLGGVRIGMIYSYCYFKVYTVR